MGERRKGRNIRWDLKILKSSTSDAPKQKSPSKKETISNNIHGEQTEVPSQEDAARFGGASGLDKLKDGRSQPLSLAYSR